MLPFPRPGSQPLSSLGYYLPPQNFFPVHNPNIMRFWTYPNQPSLFLHQIPNIPPIKIEASCKIEPSLASDQISYTPSFTNNMKIEENSFESSITKKEENYSSDQTNQRFINLSLKVEEMVNYFINVFGKASDFEIDQERTKYVQNQRLLSLFDTLRSKYSSTAKCRDDMVRFTLRKALTSLRDSLRKRYNLSAKAASLELCKKYFGVKSEQTVKQEIDEENQQEVLDFLLPYKKNSRNKTPNMCFISEIFGSEEFRQDYMAYLSKFDKILEIDNQKKVAKFRDFLVECLEKNMIHKVQTFKRVPWLKTWMKAMKVVACELLEAKTWKSYHKRSKVKVAKTQKATPFKIEDSNDSS